MAHVTLPLLSGTASGSVGRSITFVPSQSKNIVRSFHRTTANYGIRQKLVTGFIPILSTAVSAIKQQSDTVPKGNQCFKALLSRVPLRHLWQQYSIRLLFSHFRFVDELYDWLDGFTAIPDWIACSSQLNLPFMGTPLYQEIFEGYRLMQIQATLLYLLKPWLGELAWPETNPKLWEQEEIFEFLISQQND